METAILTQGQDVNTRQILDHLDTLFNDIQDKITFDPTRETEVIIGILAKDKKNSSTDKPVFLKRIQPYATVHCGRISKTGLVSGTKILAILIQDNFCDLMRIPRAPQLDALGNFI